MLLISMAFNSHHAFQWDLLTWAERCAKQGSPAPGQLKPWAELCLQKQGGREQYLCPYTPAVVISGAFSSLWVGLFPRWSCRAVQKKLFLPCE